MNWYEIYKTQTFKVKNLEQTGSTATHTEDTKCWTSLAFFAAQLNAETNSTKLSPFRVKQTALKINCQTER